MSLGNEEGQKTEVCALILLIKRIAKKICKMICKRYAVIYFWDKIIKSPQQISNKIGSVIN